MTNNIKSYILVSIQFAILIALFLTTSDWRINWGAIIFLFLSVILMLWAIGTMSKSRLRVQPIPAPDAEMIIQGPYKYIRHPMYTSLLLGSVGLLVLDFTWFRLVLLIALFADLLFKLHFEEQLLIEKFTKYKDYKQVSKKLIPFMY
jgi:protein-S-isoprenylcysteine O-methyltransferase Ste14